MKFGFWSKTKIVLVVFIAISATVGLFVWQEYPFGVKKYKTITLGMQAAEGAGTPTAWAPPYHIVPEESKLYVYSLGDITMCIGSDCGIGGYFVECLGGWVSGYKDMGDVFDYGLRGVGVNINKQKVITVADKDAKIVGIYPGASIRNLPYIMRNHRDLVSEDQFKHCWDLMPRRWK
ncbi:MAG: hypothetical protein Q8N28_00905 [bacterium]|nr:hypothetical protein [bacterium]